MKLEHHFDSKAETANFHLHGNIPIVAFHVLGNISYSF